MDENVTHQVRKGEREGCGECGGVPDAICGRKTSWKIRLKRGGVRVTLYPAFGNLRSKSRRLERSVLQENGLWPATEPEERDADGDWEKVRERWTLSGGQREQGRRAGALIRALCSEPSARSDRPDRRQRSMGASRGSGCSGGLDRTRLLSPPSRPFLSSLLFSSVLS